MYRRYSLNAEVVNCDCHCQAKDSQHSRAHIRGSISQWSVFLFQDHFIPLKLLVLNYSSRTHSLFGNFIHRACFQNLNEYF